eukprot:5124959-Pyramimonas_sp.AAC.1
MGQGALGSYALRSRVWELRRKGAVNEFWGTHWLQLPSLPDTRTPRLDIPGASIGPKVLRACHPLSCPQGLGNVVDRWELFRSLDVSFNIDIRFWKLYDSLGAVGTFIPSDVLVEPLVADGLTQSLWRVRAPRHHPAGHPPGGGMGGDCAHSSGDEDSDHHGEAGGHVDPDDEPG